MCYQGLAIDRAGLDFLIDHLMCESPNHLKNQNDFKRARMADICEKYKYIKEVFPDIEPKYLMEYLTKKCGSPQENWQNTYNFIKFFIISHHYPKVDGYIKRLQRIEKIKWLTTDFKVDQFLEIFPDPFKFFEDRNRKCRFNYTVLEYLKRQFNRHQVTTIEKFYRMNNYNASLTAKELANLKPNIKNRRKVVYRQTDNINFLQEFAFIKYRKAIQKYMDESRAREAELTKKFQKLNLPLKCEFCSEKECLSGERYTCDNGHVFCEDCINHGINSLPANDKNAKLECFLKCGGHIGEAGLRNISLYPKAPTFTGSEQTDKLETDKANFVRCPSCQFATTQTQRNNIFKCTNPECGKETRRIYKRRIQASQVCEGASKITQPEEQVVLRRKPHQIDLNANNLPARRFLLPPVRAQDVPKKCLLIDLDETLVHCSLKPINNADFVVYVGDVKPDIYYVLKRPHVDQFLRRMGELFECVLFTASVAEYANSIVNVLDKWGIFRARLFRGSCVSQNGHYVKDLKGLGRDLQKVAILDDRPASYSFQPDNGVPITPWNGDRTDSKLLDLIPFFEQLSAVESVYEVLCN
ncbi:hypothetical protein QAD02_000379, partial [Eretmocerus hayati]